MKIWTRPDGALIIEDRGHNDVEVSTKGEHLRLQLGACEDRGYRVMATELDHERVTWLHDVLGHWLTTGMLPALEEEEKRSKPRITVQLTVNQEAVPKLRELAQLLNEQRTETEAKEEE